MAELEQRFLDPGYQAPSREQIVLEMMDYVERQLVLGARLHTITRHMLGLYAGQAGARRWRRALGEQACRTGAGIEVLQQALGLMAAAA
jgi:tRNA-dihydrouridine synthase A